MKMKKARYTAEQILNALKQVDGGETATVICRKMGASEATFYNWKKKYSGMGVGDVRELRQLRSHGRVARQTAIGRDERWRMDFVTNRLENGSYFRILTVVDQYTRECLEGG